jgi:hypothetical protein
MTLIRLSLILLVVCARSPALKMSCRYPADAQKMSRSHGADLSHNYQERRHQGRGWAVLSARSASKEQIGL